MIRQLARSFSESQSAIHLVHSCVKEKTNGKTMAAEAAADATVDLKTKQQQQLMLADEDPLLISQSLTYVTDDGGTLHSFQSAPLSTSFQIQLFTLEMFFIAGVLGSISMGAHGAVVGVIIGNLILLAWFWYNLVRSVDVTADGSLRFWIGNIEVDCPYDKIVSIRRVSTKMPCSLMVTAQPYRGFLATPVDGVAIVTTLPSTPFWLWPRSAGKPDRSCCCLSCPRLTVVFSPSGGSTAFIREVEGEMRNFANASNIEPSSRNGAKQRTSTNNPDYLDV